MRLGVKESVRPHECIELRIALLTAISRRPTYGMNPSGVPLAAQVPCDPTGRAYGFVSRSLQHLVLIIVKSPTSEESKREKTLMSDHSQIRSAGLMEIHVKRPM